MKLYSIESENVVYADAKIRVVPGHEDRAVIVYTNHMVAQEWFPCETEGMKIDGSILLSECMGFDPEEFDPKSEETRLWVEKWSYPLEVANAMVAQVNRASQVK